jgi:bacteriocin biosynthesis cyclodehydratase domain-containing protein
VTLGALYYAGPVRRTLRVALLWVGQPALAFAEWLDLLCKRRADIAVVSDVLPDADLVLVIRTNDTLQQASALTSGETRPHLLIDLAYHSTLVVGPFVVPGQTACLGCNAGRLMHLWGDMQPPVLPAMNAHVELAAAVIMEHMQTFRTRGTINALVGNTWALDTATWESRLHPVFRLPWCPVCAGRRQEKDTGPLNGVF